LFYTVWNGHTSLLRYLLNNGLGDIVNNLNDSHESPLYYACRNGHPECVSVLLQAGAVIDNDLITETIICSTALTTTDTREDQESQERKKRAIMSLLGMRETGV
jgi:ankyrin repeat protein